MRANNQFVEIEAQNNKGFQDSETPLTEGKVLSVGDKVEYIKKGYKVLFDKNKAMQQPLGGKTHFFVREETILAYETK